MRSGTSYFNGTVFKKTVTRFWPLWTAYLIVWLIAMPLNGLMLLSSQARSTIKNIGYIEQFACRTVPQMAQFALWLSALAGLLAAMAVLSHLYGARSANFFATLPIRREGMFLTQYLAGLAFLIVPNLITALLTLCVEAAGGWVSIQCLLYWLAVSCGTCFFFYSMAVFCGMFTGHILALPVFYGVFNVLGYGLWAMSSVLCRAYCYGYAGNRSGLGYEAARWCTPIWKLQNSIWSRYWSSNMASDTRYTAQAGAETIELELEGLPQVGAYVLAAVVLTACAFLLYRARRMESAGDVVSVNPMKPVFKYGVAVCSGLFLGQVTANMVNMHEPGLMVSMLAWAVIGYFAAQMLLDKSFRVFKKWKGAVAVAGVFIVLFIVLGFDLTGFETRMPDPNQVEKVRVYGLDAMGLGDDGDYVYEDLNEPGQIELIMALHQAAIGQRDGDMPSGDDTISSTNLDVTYTMKDGSTLSREYSVWLDRTQAGQEGTAAWILQQLYNDRDLYWEIYGFAEMEQLMAEEGWWMEQARYCNYDYSYDYGYYDYYDYDYYDGYGKMEPYPTRTQEPDQYFYGKDAQALFEAVREDYRAGRIGVRDLSQWDPYTYNRDYERVIRFTLVDGTGRQSSVSIAVQDTASSTFAALEELAQE